MVSPFGLTSIPTASTSFTGRTGSPYCTIGNFQLIVRENCLKCAVFILNSRFKQHCALHSLFIKPVSKEDVAVAVSPVLSVAVVVYF
jgi:hypothetical protein